MCVGRVLDSDNNVCQLTDRTRIQNFPKDNENYTVPPEEDVQFSEDILALSTRYTKDVLFWLNESYKSFKKTNVYKILCHTTQPAHLVISLAVLCLAFLCFSKSQKPQAATVSPLWTLVYLGSFSTHFGAQIWMTFVSGLALFFTMPRHIFGSIQKVLFPKYFFLNATLSLLTLAVFLRAKNTELRTLEIGIQAIGMSVCFLTELVIYLYLTPPLLSLITIKTAIEKEAGVGMEVGKFDPGRLRNCTHYLKIHKTFRKVHMTIAIGNIVTMACTTLHLYYLASKLCIFTF
ncbi:transmembrane protein 205 [Cylas formicarius]|uniref:transmembrane protein 205 n=1 Tax=Cylas formicarius TaxID=197179 RepID=UPI0029586560|nr:transmembrane protein 205 [Cylas formicarius]